MVHKEEWDYSVNSEPFKAISKSGTWVKFKPLSSGTHTGPHYFFKSDAPFDHVDVYESQRETKNKMIPAKYAKGSFVGTPEERRVSVSGAIDSYVAPLDMGVTDITVVKASGSWGVRTNVSGYVLLVNFYSWKDSQYQGKTG
jgi:hypothetical protein